MPWMDVGLAVGFRIANNGVFAELMSSGTHNINGLQIRLAAIASATQLDLTDVFSGKTQGLYFSVP